MKRLKSNFIVVVVFLALFVMGSETTPQPRVVRIMLNSELINWRFSVNGTGRIEVVSNSSLTNKLTNLHLRLGDLIVLGTLPNRTQKPLAGTWEWTARYCGSNNVAVYFFNSKESESALFVAPVYHWVAPFNNPRDLANTSFFHEGIFLGVGTDGYSKMLQEIERTRPREFFLLGGLYDINSGFGTAESPFEDPFKHFATEIVVTDYFGVVTPAELSA